MENPLIVQSDASLMLDSHSPLFEAARNAIMPFSELEKSPEHFHSYRITNLSVWNAAGAGMEADEIEKALAKFSRYEVPENVLVQVRDTYKRYGLLELCAFDEEGKTLLLTCPTHAALLTEIANNRKIAPLLTLNSGGGFLVNLINRGSLKRELVRLGWPVKDLAPLVDGAPLSLHMKPGVEVREYQQRAVGAFLGDKRAGFGFGVITLPCGSGKTIVGIACMAELGMETLIIAANIAAARQWMRELLDKTDIDPSLIGEYSGERKEIKPITVATYQILVWRRDTEAEFEHFELFRKRAWGLVVYDEAHLLPAPVFRITGEIQSMRRLGLTATLVREDGAESDVFSLVGPKRFDMPWKDLERLGWIAKVNCVEVKINMDQETALSYATVENRAKIRIAAENPRKVDTTLRIVKRHADSFILVIGQYIGQLKTLAHALKAPLITGKTANAERDRLYEAFRRGDERILVVSKVANFSIDLPDAAIAIQVSGAFGSRQEEAQRLGRILRPKACGGTFYSLVSRYTEEELFAQNRQKFLTEQGYGYEINGEDDFV